MRLRDQRGSGQPGRPDAAPEHAPIVLVALILVAAVANLNLAVANVALPDGRARRATLGGQLTKSFSSAAKTSFVDGANWAYTAGIVAILIGATMVFVMFPRRDREIELLAEYHTEDTDADIATASSG